MNFTRVICPRPRPNDRITTSHSMHSLPSLEATLHELLSNQYMASIVQAVNEGARRGEVYIQCDDNTLCGDF